MDRFASSSLVTNSSVYPASGEYKVGMIFGTSKYVNGNRINIFWADRLSKIVELYRDGTIQYILISGDNRRLDYNEPEEFKKELIRQGVDPERIVLDYAGLSTRDSIARAKTIFGVEKVILVSQEFQLTRAIVACEYWKIQCLGVPTRKLPSSIAPMVYLREYPARVKLRRDILTPEPDIGGEKEIVPWE